MRAISAACIMAAALRRAIYRGRGITVNDAACNVRGNEEGMPTDRDRFKRHIKEGLRIFRKPSEPYSAFFKSKSAGRVGTAIVALCADRVGGFLHKKVNPNQSLLTT